MLAPARRHSAAPPYLQSRPVHVFGQFHANPVGDDEGVIGVDLWREEPQVHPRKRVQVGMAAPSPGRV